VRRSKAAIRHIDANDTPPGSIGGLVHLIKPAVAAVMGKSGNLLENAIKANVKQGVERLKRLEPILADPVKKGTLKVVGAVYDLHSGKVTAFV
jgi:carbonic anhydrase